MKISTHIPKHSISDRALFSAYVILRGKKLVANVHVAYPRDGAGTLRVEVWGHSDKAPRFQSATASGYGYDKFTAALSGLTIDGHTLTDHSEITLSPPKGRKTFPVGYKAPKGYHLINYQSAKDCDGNEREEGYISCYKASGLDYLRDKGYTVIRAL